MCPTEHGRWCRVRRVLAARPLLAAAMGCVLGVGAAAWQPWLGPLVVILAACLPWVVGSWRLALGVFGCGVVSLAVTGWRDGQARAAAGELPGLPVGDVRGRLLEDARGGVERWRAPVVLADGVGAGQRVWWTGRGEVPVEGAVVTARGRFMPFEAPRNPGAFDRQAWARRDGLVAVLVQVDDDVEVEVPVLAAWGAHLRRGFRERVTAGLEESSTAAIVIRAVVMGERPADADELVEAFRLSGCLHVFSVSGLHVAMVAAMGWLVLGGLGVSRRAAVPLLVILVFSYAWLTGGNPPAVRASWMALVFLGAFVCRRRPDLLNALGAVLLVGMLWDGRMLFRPGVQLSYGVVAAIALGLPLIRRCHVWLAQGDPYLPRPMHSRWQRWSLAGRRWLASSLGVSLAAGAGSAPLTIWHFGVFTPVSVLAAVFMVPLVFVVLMGGILTVAVSPLPPVSRLVAAVNGRMAEACAAVADGCARLPGGHWKLGQVDEPQWLVYALERGDAAACFADGTGGGVMFDCGGPASFRWEVLPSLKRLGVEPRAVVLSHPDGGHLGGGAVVAESLPIRQVVVPVRRARSPALRDWHQRAPMTGVEVLAPAQAGRLVLPDGARLEVLHVPDPLAVNVPADDRVMVCRIHWHGWRILWTSDAGMAVEDGMLDAGVDVAADVVVAGRHRSDLSLSDRFLEAVCPRVVIVANNSYPAEERVDPGMMDHWRERGVQWIELSKSGGVTIRVGSDGELRLSGVLDDGCGVVLDSN